MYPVKRQLLAISLTTGIALAGAAVVPLGVQAAPTQGPDSAIFRTEADGLSTTAFESGSYLTGPSKRPAGRIVLDYIAAHRSEFGLSSAGVRALKVRKDVVTEHDGAHHLVLGQDVDGIPVHGAVVTALVDKLGRLVLVGGPTGDVRTSGSASLSAGEAIAIAAERGGADNAQAPAASRTKSKGKHTFSNPYRGKGAGLPVSAELVWQLQPDRSLRLAWHTDVDVSSDGWYDSVVDAETGTVLQHESRYDHSDPEGNVIREEDPDVSPGGQQITPFTGIDGSWVTGTTTSGNNVNAYLDRNDDDLNNEYQPTAADQHFNYTFNDSWRTTASVTSQAALDTDRDATITQLFYYTNDLHDWLYNHGFNEASGNFQVNNFGRGGLANDAVQAEAQDGWAFGCPDANAPNNEDPQDRCLNNANFGTGADGSAARMQMFLWTQPPFGWRDGTMDGSLIAHEYGHGVSNRLVPGTIANATNQAGSLGEGWSDALAFLRWGDATFARYSSNDTTGGLRTSNYDVHPDTYGDYSTAVGSPHRNGEIWAATLYDLRVVLGLNATTIRLVLDGMRNTANGPNPTFLNARDGILAADMTSNAGANRCAIWAVFAQRGMGTNAVSNGLHAVPTENFEVPAECLPTADAGGPYNTDEGTNVGLTGSGTKGSDATAGAVTSYAWDLDNDGEYDDSTLQNPTFTDVGQDGSFTVGLQVTDAFGNTDTDTATVNVANVAPVVSIDAITPINEHGTVTVTGTISDPGWEDALTATIDFDDGAGAQTLSGTLENARPNATLGFSVNKQYGDDGTFVVSVSGFDDDASGNGTENAVVANLNPTATIDGSGEQVYDGKSAFVLEAGEDLTVPVRGTDQGSDDLDFSWIWGDGTTTAQASLVNPPALDPLKSPSVQPRDVTLADTYDYSDACLYNLDVLVEDDDGGSAGDEAVVLVTGNATVSKGHGWWLNEFRAKSNNQFTPAELLCYLDIVNYFSKVFSEERTADTRASATQVLNAPAKSPEGIVFDQHALGAWLNFANGSVKLTTPVDTDNDGIDDSTFGAVMLTAETVRVDPSSTKAQIRAQKDVIARIITQSE